MKASSLFLILAVAMFLFGTFAFVSEKVLLAGFCYFLTIGDIIFWISHKKKETKGS